MLKKGSFYKQCSWLIVLILLFSVALFSCSENTTSVQEEVLNQAFTKGVIKGELPARTTDVTSVRFNVNLGMNQVYDSAAKMVTDKNLTKG